MNFLYIKGKNIIKLLFASFLLFFLLILSWRSFYESSCLALVFPIVWTAVISQSIFDIKMRKRFCFRNCFFNEGSFFYRIFSSALLIIIYAILLSSIMVLTMMYEIIVYETGILMYLVFHVILVVFIFVFFIDYFSRTLKKEYQEIFVREWTVKLSAAFFFVAYAFYIYNGYVPVYLESTIKDTMVSASNSIGSSCAITDYLLRLKAEIDSLLWWGVDQSTGVKKISTLTWVLFIIINGFAILGLNRFVVQSVFRIDKVIHEQKRQSNN